MRDVNKLLLNRGWAFKALPSHNAQSIGGIISTDVHGTGKDWGWVSEMVLEIKVIDGKGDVYVLNPRRTLPGGDRRDRRGGDHFGGACASQGTLQHGADLRARGPRLWEEHIEQIIEETTISACTFFRLPTGARSIKESYR